MHLPALLAFNVSDERNVSRKKNHSQKLYKCEIVDQDVDVRNAACCFEKIEFDYQDKYYQKANFAIFGYASLPCQHRNATSDISVCFYSDEKKWIDTLLKEM